MPELNGHPMVDMKPMGHSDDGGIIGFELVLNSGQRLPILIPAQMAPHIILALQGLNSDAIIQRAKLGQPTEHAVSARIHGHGIGVGVSPGKPTVVAMMLMTGNSERPTNIHLSMSPDTARVMAKDLLDNAQEAEATPPPKAN